MTLIDWLIAKQQELGLTDTAFARLLGFHHTAWMRFRRGEMNPSLRLMRAANARWPESAIEICHAALTEEPDAA